MMKIDRMKAVIDYELHGAITAVGRVMKLMLKQVCGLMVNSLPHHQLKCPTLLCWTFLFAQTPRVPV
jgi:hypothetical protein